MYLHIETGAYPLTEQDVIARHPECSFPVPFSAPDGYLLVEATAQPAHDAAAERTVELPPLEVGGVWRQTWAVVPLTAEEIDAREREAARDVQRARGMKIAAINSEYERRTAAISASYPSAERESWPVQTREARALQADDAAATPWIDAAAAARGLDRAELARRIVALDMAYRSVHGALSGTRQRLEELAWNAADIEQIEAIDEAAGWPT
ncbi:hypothetical protein QRO11_12000 [Paracidovorax citrulli]|uniref:hypothetical protein n=1 Tax=Paracidovorax citrulli TaxID=80869 RepID=UPI00088E01EF|nr:hypothetical protein [Paracidovorax citrulli]UMT88384.1 hypothetical protein FRC90_10075 [Paracidovorax citrulli]WIY32707.1 hypothetical protein QRO11_12000 [Paracidovorax citrulli]SDJ30617.1 hypothetical protein SAMN04489709_10365 [Paracidovorax citrulli]